MSITQISVKLNDKPGELCKVSDLLADEGINIRAFAASVHGDDSQFHMVLDSNDKGMELLKSKGYQVVERKVLAVETPDHPGGLKAILNPLKQTGVNIEFLYPVIGRINDNAILILGVDNYDEALNALKRNYLRVLESGFILPKS